MQPLKRVGLALLTVAFLLPASVVGYYFAYVQWAPYDRPLPKLSGVASERFVINYPSAYTAILAFDNRAMSSNRLQCLIGLAGEFSPEPDCKTEKSVLNVRWNVVHDGETVASGTYTGQHGSVSVETTDAFIASFSAGRGEYVIHVEFEPGAEILESAKPRLSISASPVRFENAYVKAAGSVVGGLILGVFGIVLLVLGWVRSRSTPVPAAGGAPLLD
jgi:hypothetical protein